MMIDRHRAAIVALGGVDVDPADYRAATVDGLDDYLHNVGVRHFTAREYVTPHHPEIAARFGYEEFLPDVPWWPRVGALLLLADRCRTAARVPVVCRNGWRPAPYNAAVSGAASSDHVEACAVDLDYPNEDARERAMGIVLEPLWRSPAHLELSIGVGKATTHVGLYSVLGKRRWTY